jgi:hypothetical protein
LEVQHPFAIGLDDNSVELLWQEPLAVKGGMQDRDGGHLAYRQASSLFLADGSRACANERVRYDV